MAFMISPFQFSGLYGGFYVLSPFAAMGGPFGVPLSTYAAAVIAGSWFLSGEYVSGSANWRFSATPPPLMPGSPQYPAAPEDRARDYVRTTLNKPWLPQYGRNAVAYDAYTTPAHQAIRAAEDAAGAKGRDDAQWKMADLMRGWMEKQNERAAFISAEEKIKQLPANKKSPEVLLANLLVPGSTEVTDDAAQKAMSLLTQQPSEKTAPKIMAALLQQLGGESVLNAMRDEIAGHLNRS